jgi:hypothetical protein
VRRAGGARARPAGKPRPSSCGQQGSPGLGPALAPPPGGPHLVLLGCHHHAGHRDELQHVAGHALQGRGQGGGGGRGVSGGARGPGPSPGPAQGAGNPCRRGARTRPEGAAGVRRPRQPQATGARRPRPRHPGPLPTPPLDASPRGTRPGTCQRERLPGTAFPGGGRGQGVGEGRALGTGGARARARGCVNGGAPPRLSVVHFGGAHGRGRRKGLRLRSGSGRRPHLLHSKLRGDLRQPAHNDRPHLRRHPAGAGAASGGLGAREVVGRREQLALAGHVDAGGRGGGGGGVGVGRGRGGAGGAPPAAACGCGRIAPERRGPLPRRRRALERRSKLSRRAEGTERTRCARARMRMPRAATPRARRTRSSPAGRCWPRAASHSCSGPVRGRCSRAREARAAGRARAGWPAAWGARRTAAASPPGPGARQCDTVGALLAARGGCDDARGLAARALQKSALTPALRRPWGPARPCITLKAPTSSPLAPLAHLIHVVGAAGAGPQHVAGAGEVGGLAGGRGAARSAHLGVGAVPHAAAGAAGPAADDRGVPHPWGARGRPVDTGMVLPNSKTPYPGKEEWAGRARGVREGRARRKHGFSSVAGARARRAASLRRPQQGLATTLPHVGLGCVRAARGRCERRAGPAGAAARARAPPPTAPPPPPQAPIARPPAPGDPAAPRQGYAA